MSGDVAGAGLEEVLEEWFARERDEIHTAFPGKVESYDPATQLANVLPLIRRPVPTTDGDHIYEDLPVLPLCPVLFPRAGNAFLHLPLETGHTGLVICCESAFKHWRQKTDASRGDPGDLRRHHLAHTVFLPANFYRKSQKLADASTESARIALGYDAGGAKIRVKPGVGREIEFDGNTVKLGATATKAIAVHQDNVLPSVDMATWMSQVATTINGVIPGSISPPAVTVIGNVQASTTKGKAE